MKNIINLIVVCACSFNSILNAQIIFEKIPFENNVESPIFTSDLLNTINWDSLKQFCDTTDGHYAYKRIDNLLIKYEYVKQGRVVDFTIISFNGKVVEFNYQSEEVNSTYFDRTVWLEYAHQYLPNLPDNLKLTIIESPKTLKAYYHLLGVGTHEEYGWICEYSTIGGATERRIAVINLLDKRELLLKLLDFSNVYVQLYVADALIYDDYIVKQLIEDHKLDKDFAGYLENTLLTRSEWEKIYNIRDSNQMVNTCINGTGSYRGHKTSTSEILNEKSIDEIPQKYNELKQMGYFR